MICTCGHDAWTHKASTDMQHPLSLGECIRTSCNCEQFVDEDYVEPVA